MTRPVLAATGGYDALRRDFRWRLPARLNIAAQVCDDWVERDPERLAIIDLTHGARRDVSYGDLQTLSLRAEAALHAHGVGQGDRVGVLLSQSPWTAAVHIACWRIGAISVPLFTLFRHDALAVRIEDAGAALVVTDDENGPLLNGLGVPVLHLSDMPVSVAGRHPVAQTGPEDPAVLIYTSGTTGAPKGALHGHRVLTGHLPGVEISHDRLGQPGDVLWTPADWAWIGGLFDVLMPGLALGVPVVAARLSRFTPEAARDVIRAGTVRNVFFPPTALRMLKASGMALPGLRSVASGGEPLGAEMLDWGKQAFGLTINEFYGQTECNMVASSAASLFAPRPGCIGKPVPGFELAVLGPDGPIDRGEGDIAIRRGAGSMFLGYWNRAEATAEKFRGDWMLTGDRGAWEAGYLRFVGREDDVITSAGYRIGPAEIEDCLLRHPAVASAAVIGVPDAERTERVRAHVVLRDGAKADGEALRDHVHAHLSAHLVPREVRFETALPMTVTGKIIRKELKRRALEGDA
ncbi:AMP-binding protein [Pararhodobacter marinus]|uniref:AMP-binding protein n=1 Tax=Pararhodobacter marinus TaxID=2184063 RepID=UPI003517BC35